MDVEGPCPFVVTSRSRFSREQESRWGHVLRSFASGIRNQEAILIGIASLAGIAIDNARLFQQAQWVQTELKRSNEELRRANQDLGTFAYSAADLQEPLRTISLCSELLQPIWVRASG
jgi:GAF domain-containing protein